MLDKFVCVRIVYANGMDLSLFQFDYDLSMATIFMNANRTIYARYGSRSAHGEEGQLISLEGLRSTLIGVLQLHAEYPGNARALAGKQPRQVKVRHPEEYTHLKRFTSRIPEAGTELKNCMHCHQILEAERREYRERGQPIPDDVLYPWPLPLVLGLRIDVRSRCTVAEVAKGSLAEKAGFRPGDDVVALDGQPIVSLADMQWVLHHAGDSATLKADVERLGKRQPLTLRLTAGWRRQSDISWRTTTWDLRRMATGGLVLETLPDAARRDLKLPDDQPALRVGHVGQYNEHAAAKNAGFQKGDILLRLNGRMVPPTEADFIRYAVQNCQKGQKLPVEVLRGERKLELMLPMQ